MTMMIRFLESQIAVADQVGRVRALFDGVGCPSSVTGSADSDLWSQVGNLDATSTVALKCSVAVSKTPRAIDLCEKRFPSGTLAADLAMGLVRLGIENGDQEVISQVTSLRSEIELIGGTLIIERAPSFIRLEADAWGDAGPEVEIMRAIKQKYDPNSVLSPGRFASGI